MIVLLLGCAGRQPPVLFPEPVPSATFEEVEPGALDPEEAPVWSPRLAGEALPEHAVCGPVGGSNGYLALLAAQERLASVEPALSLCEAGRQRDRTYAADRFTTAWDAYQDADRDARLHRMLVPVGVVGGFLAGAGVTLGVFWAADNL